MEVVSITLLKDFLHSVDFHLSDVDLILVLSNLQLCFLVYLLLSGSHSIQLCSHVLDLSCLGALHVRIAPDLHMALLNFSLGRFIFLCHFSLSLLRFGKLNFDIAE